MSPQYDSPSPAYNEQGKFTPDNMAHNSQSHTHNHSVSTTPNTADMSGDSKSIGSTRSRGSAVLQRAREYNRIIDKNRSKSSERGRGENADEDGERSQSNPRSAASGTQGTGSGGRIMSQRERAMASVQNDSVNVRVDASKKIASNNNDNINSTVASTRRTNQPQSVDHGRPKVNKYRSSPTPSQKSSHRYKTSPTRDNQSTPQAKSSNGKLNRPDATGAATKPSGGANGEEGMAIVTPELLVDALSGHEDGLLAIAERLMEHYDTGYDAMGEAIIDAFADVQKLFQHVVEAAHMEGAAYEAGRKEEEIEKLKRALGGEGMGNDEFMDGGIHSPSSNRINNKSFQSPDAGNGGRNRNSNSPTTTSPLRHEEFIDQDVRDTLMGAIRKGQGTKDANKYNECYQIYENACNSASALLPVDSDHRGRLQLSIARAENMSPERACAILRYVMDDVLRSGLNSNSKVVMPDPSQRGDCVLTRPSPKTRGEDSSDRFKGVSMNDSNVLQSSEEALASMVEEMKEILSAPVYDQSPLQNVAERFWTALSEAQRSNLKNEERLEQKLATLKAEYLLAREEWEEKYNSLSYECDDYKKKAKKVEQMKYMEQARKGMSQLGNIEYCSDDDGFDPIDGMDSPGSCSQFDSPRSRNAPSVTTSSSFVSLSQHAKSIVGSFSSCRGSKNGGSGSSRRDSSPPSAASTYLSSRKTSSSTSRR